MTVTGDLVTAASGAVIGAPPPAFAPRLWHGFTPAPAMSAFAIMVGAIMLRHYRRLLSLWDRLPLPDAHALHEPGVGAAEIGRAHVLTPVTNAHIVCRLLL